ncbi:hypothetical protein RRG08_011450 [Elysia crispata]|uniref:Uncharacterized protein n=1 Tax=Elysia crispata TaxID=231223 RepID=A0AAE0ZWE0_9GAST|nr:hypothetical protein RRG08_011450 [Elysia crispata]
MVWKRVTLSPEEWVTSDLSCRHHLAQTVGHLGRWSTTMTEVIPATCQKCDALYVYRSPLPVKTVMLCVCSDPRYLSELWCSVCVVIPATCQNCGALFV